jgi:hypothetical protein
MIELQKAIESLQNRLKVLSEIGDLQKFKEWKTRTLQTLAHIYGENHTSYKALEKVRGFSYSDRTREAKSEATELLSGLIEDLNNFGFPKQLIENNKGVNLHVNQQATQNQTTNFTFNLNHFVEAIKDELKGGQVKELKAILDSDEEPEKKKKSFFEKIKSFGSDVSSNILANVLTNPDVYTNIGGML